MEQNKNKMEVAQRIRELRVIAWQPWFELQGLILRLDGNHNRIHNRGIKHYTVQLCDALDKLITDLEREYSCTEKSTLIELQEDINGTDIQEDAEAPGPE